MPINKNFPNYTKIKPKVTVISHFAGQNRATRRSQAWELAHQEQFKRKSKLNRAYLDTKEAIRKSVARKQALAHARALKRKLLI